MEVTRTRRSLVPVADLPAAAGRPLDAAVVGTSAAAFATLARIVADESRAFGCTPPGFRSPMRPGGHERVLLRTEHGPVVAVAFRGRCWEDIARDLVDGVAVVNGIGARERDRLLEHVKARWSAAVAA